MIKCERCGYDKLETISEGKSSGVKCPKCGWDIVTTCAHPLQFDRQKYSVLVNGDRDLNVDKVKAIAKTCRCSVVEARKKLLEGFEMRDLTADETMPVLQMLKQVDALFKVTPRFPHKY